MFFIDILVKVFTNQIFISSGLAWILAQVIKMVYYYRQFHRLNFRLLVGTGGMPSAHSSLVSCLATVIGIKEGFESTFFIISLFLAIIIMSDAAGVRRAAGKQAEVLNQLSDEIYAGKGIRQERLKELLGHSPRQVFAGCFVGIVTGVIFMALPKFI